MTTGKYVIVSGGEGTGKSTLVNALGGFYPEVILTREPGSGDFGAAVRKMLVADEYQLSDWTEYYLFLADRAEHMATLVKPALARGLHVLSDRGWPETFAYQLYAKMGRTSTQDYLREIHAREWPNPDLWIYLDLDPNEGLRRRGLAGELSTIDRRSLEYHQKVRQGFKLLAEHVDFPTAAIPADQSPSEVLAEAQRHLTTLFNSAQ